MIAYAAITMPDTGTHEYEFPVTGESLNDIHAKVTAYCERKGYALVRIVRR